MTKIYVTFPPQPHRSDKMKYQKKSPSPSDRETRKKNAQKIGNKSSCLPLQILNLGIFAHYTFVLAPVTRFFMLHYTLCFSILAGCYTLCFNAVTRFSLLCYPFFFVVLPVSVIIL